MSEDLRETVRRKYGSAAQDVAERTQQAGCGCCGSGADTKADGGFADPITRDLYDRVTADTLPEKAVLASLGCGNPTALAELHQGEVVLDLGSGGGIDVLLSARRVGPTGKAYGLDMTDEMLALARANAAEAGADNVEFLKGEIEDIPLADDSVDVIISNCVINLSADKDRVLAEAFRVLRPGGRFAVSDVVSTDDDIPAAMRRDIELWVGCVAGALTEAQFTAKLARAGFTEISLEPTRVYRVDDARQFLEEAGLDVDEMADRVDGKFMSAFVRASKPAPASTDGTGDAARSRGGSTRPSPTGA